MISRCAKRAGVEASTRSADRQNGFSTIESMVAIAILGLVLIPLYSFQGTLVSGSAKIERNLDRTAAARIAETYLNGLVPAMLQANGAQIGDFDLTWTITPVQSERFALTASGIPGRFYVQLIRVDYDVSKSGKLVVSDSVHRLSWLETGPFLSDLDG